MRIQNFIYPMVVVASGVSLAGTLPQKPNFIQILTDDQGWGDLRSFGHDRIISPNVDRLAKEGIKFTNCYAADGVCSPSRSSILTGRTPFRNGVYRWVRPNSVIHLPAKEITLPQMLRKNGYQTAHFGKWHVSYYAEKKNGGEDSYYDFKLGTKDQPTMKEYGYDYWFATGNVARPNHKNPRNFFLNGKCMGEMEGFSAQIVAAQIKEWMENVRKPGQPFFMTVWFHEPHGPINSDPRFLAKYKKTPDAALKQFYANITQLDEAVGTIVSELKKAGVYDNTMIWYTSDNGPEGNGYGTYNKSDNVYGGSRHRGTTGGLRGRKRHTHEGGIRVPGIISWPAGLKKSGILPGGLDGTPIIGSDVFPTMLELAGVEAPKGVVLDGTSIVPLLRGKSLKRARPLYWRNVRNSYAVAIREGDWKIISDSKRTKFELYNLRDDFRETTDLSAHYPKVFEKMKKDLIAYDREVLAEGPDWWKNEVSVKKSMPVE